MALTLHKCIDGDQVPLTVIAHYSSPSAQTDAEASLDMWVSSCFKENPGRPIVIMGDFNRPPTWVR